MAWTPARSRARTLTLTKPSPASPAVLAVKPGPLILINAFPGVGKLTIANGVLNELGRDRAILVDNHQTSDPIEEKYDPMHPDFQEARRLQRTLALEVYVSDEAHRGKVVMFTEFLTDSHIGTSIAAEYRAAAAATGRQFLPIYLDCDIAENLRRVALEDRRGRQAVKIMDVDFVRGLREDSKLLVFDDVQGLTVDVSRSWELEDQVEEVLKWVKEKAGLGDEGVAEQATETEQKEDLDVDLKSLEIDSEAKHAEASKLDAAAKAMNKPKFDGAVKIQELAHGYDTGNSSPLSPARETESVGSDSEKDRERAMFDMSD